MPADVNVYGVTVSSAYRTFCPARSRAAPSTSSADVVRLAHQAADRAVDLREVREVAELVEGGQLGGRRRHPGAAGCRRASSSTVGTDAEPTR